MKQKKAGIYCKDLLSNRTIIQELPMRLLSTFSGIDSRPTTHLGRASEEPSDDLENKELETGPFAHGFRDDPAWIGVVDDDFSFLGRRCGDSFGDFLDPVHFEELGEVVSDMMFQYVIDGCRWWRLVSTCRPS